MQYKAIIFDFDGTISDTGEGILKSAKYALDYYKIPAPNWEKLGFFVGPPLLDSFKDNFGVSTTEAEDLILKFRERYSKTGLFESHLYDGIEDMLKALKSYNIKLGIASSKPRDFVITLLNHFNIIDLFDYVSAAPYENEKETKADIINRCLNELGIQSTDALVVGDRFYDINGAKETGCDSCGVLYGYGSKEEFEKSGAKFIADKPEDVEAIALGFFEQTLSAEKIFSGRIINVHKDKIRLVNGKESTRELVDHNGGVSVCALTKDEKILLVRQFRAPYKEIVYEVPAGKLEKGEDPFKAGVREFKEECGGTAQNFFSLGELYPSPGYCGEIIHLYGATGITLGSQDLDENEFLEVKQIPLEECVEMVMNGKIKDSKTIASIMKINYLKSEKKL